MAIPGASTKTIGDLVPEVINDLQQRTDIASIVPFYLMRALQEITESYPFEELRKTGPNFALTTNVSVYPVSAFLNPGDDYSSLESLVIFLDPPTNTVDYTLNYKTPKGIEMMMSPVTVGPPNWWTRFGANLHLGPRPDKIYTMFARYQVQHPFPDDLTGLSGQRLFIPPSWEEIIAYAAALRIAVVKRWNDQADTIHKISWGDPAAGTNVDGTMARPGLVKARLMQYERDQKFNTRQLGVLVSRYTSR